VITISAERCTGCAACLEACPTGALFLVNGKADVDGTLCSECGACLSVCPNEAIALGGSPALAAQAIEAPARVPTPQITQVSTRPTPMPWQSRVLPALSAAMAWARREIVPFVFDLSADAASRDSMRLQKGSDAGRRQVSSGTGRGGGQQRRNRRRGGRG